MVGMMDCIEYLYTVPDRIAPSPSAEAAQSHHHMHHFTHPPHTIDKTQPQITLHQPDHQRDQFMKIM